MRGNVYNMSLAFNRVAEHEIKKAAAYQKLGVKEFSREAVAAMIEAVAKFYAYETLEQQELLAMEKELS